MLTEYTEQAINLGFPSMSKIVSNMSKVELLQGESLSWAGGTKLQRNKEIWQNKVDSDELQRPIV